MDMYMMLVGVLALGGLAALVGNSGDDEEDLDPLPADVYEGRDVIQRDDDRNIDDTVEGTSADEVIQTYGGEDTVDGGAGDDVIATGRHDDLVIADPGNDLVYLGSGDDVYRTDDLGVDMGEDTIWGGSGDDTISTGLGRHLIYGDDPDEDDVNGGDDMIYSQNGQDTIYGGDDDDFISALDDPGMQEARADSVFGRDGDDTLVGDGYDTLVGGSGADRYELPADLDGPAQIVYGSADRIVVNYDQGYTGEAELTVMQAGDNSQVFLDGKLIAVLPDTTAADVRAEAVLQQA
ncbi:calcium-binding protein [Paracoccus sp. Z118]|uniref:calcium-binding protein n=1 Tax=Paracoccus sp. Z118 TaxID=2851017 RepID=UPI001C2C6939|nr:calcium-binding protein [Paracoccus sp. Z118]MBV0891292.1 calcium-binding protein [Paracoccus sp. Z118]